MQLKSIKNFFVLTLRVYLLLQSLQTILSTYIKMYLLMPSLQQWCSGILHSLALDSTVTQWMLMAVSLRMSFTMVQWCCTTSLDLSTTPTIWLMLTLLTLAVSPVHQHLSLSPLRLEVSNKWPSNCKFEIIVSSLVAAPPQPALSALLQCDAPLFKDGRFLVISWTVCYFKSCQ